MDDEVFGRCPHCGFGFERATSVDPKGPRVLPGVQIGGVCFCAECGGLSIMSAGGLRKLTADEELSVRAQSQDLLDVAEKAVAIEQFGDEA